MTIKRSEEIELKKGLSFYWSPAHRLLLLLLLVSHVGNYEQKGPPTRQRYIVHPPGTQRLAGFGGTLTLPARSQDCPLERPWI